MNNIPRITYGNDFTIKIFMKEMVDGEIVAYDLSYCTDVQVQMYCSKHKTMFELPYTLDEQDSSIINAEIDYRLTHPNTMYGFVVSGYDEQGMHFQWCQKPTEGIMIVEGSSGAYLDPSIDNTIDISARIGFDVDISGVVQADWNVNDSEQPGYIKNKPNIPTKTSDLTNDSDFVDATDLATKQDILVSGTNIKTINNQSILGEGNIEIQGGGGDQVQSDYEQTNTSAVDYIKNKPDLSIYVQSSSLATVATSGDYDDLSNKPTIPAAQVQSDYNQSDSSAVDYIKNKPDLSIYAQSSNLATVATSGDYDDLSNKPSIPTKTSDLTNDSDFVDETDLATKQDTLVSGTNIKTINNQSILGEGNIEIQGGGGDQVQSDWEQTDDTQVDYIKNKPEFEEPKVMFVEEMPLTQEEDTIYVESPVYDFKTTTIDIVNEAPSSVEDDKIVIVSNPIQLKTINNQEIVGEGNIEIQGGGVQVQSDWNESDNTQVDYIKNKPDLSIYAQSSNLATVATSGDYDDLSNKPTIPAAQVQSDYNQSDSSAVDYIKNKPDLSIYAQSSNLATVATSGSYNDLSNKPTIPTQGVNAIITVIPQPRGPLFHIYIMDVLTQQIIYGGDNIPDMWNNSLANYYNYFANQNYYISYRTNNAYDYGLGSYNTWKKLNTATSSIFIVYGGKLYYRGTDSRVEIKVVYNNNDPNAGNPIGYFEGYFPTIPDAQVQSNWNETDSSSKAYIQNKPTNVSAFTNDAGYISSIPNTVVTSTTSGLKLEVVSALPVSPDSNTIYIIQ